MLRALKEYLKDDYYVISMDFQVQMSYAKFRDENVFSVAFAKAFLRMSENFNENIPGEMKVALSRLDMSFSAEEIAGMLNEYESDHSTGMDIVRISEIIYEYTSGYPFLVSKICKLIDEEVDGTEEFPGEKAA